MHHKDIGVRAPNKIIRSTDESGKKFSKAKKHIRVGDENKAAAGETLLITNFEVEEPKDKVDVRGGVKIYGTGIRGLRALKQNREEAKDLEELKKEYIEVQGDKFKRFTK
mmetsp:Transcript_18489/g.16365  ORF Transcript_18489/g.16365 Transcript_18489/m.16365 type:complete len:110 (+) Transcript_18489:274-603(+)